VAVLGWTAPRCLIRLVRYIKSRVGFAQLRRVQRSLRQQFSVFF
jgi:hypothetical protein